MSLSGVYYPFPKINWYLLQHLEVEIFPMLTKLTKINLIAYKEVVVTWSGPYPWYPPRRSPNVILSACCCYYTIQPSLCFCYWSHNLTVHICFNRSPMKSPHSFHCVYGKWVFIKGSVETKILNKHKNSASSLSNYKQSKEGPSTHLWATLVFFIVALIWNHSSLQRRSLTGDWQLQESLGFKWHLEPWCVRVHHRCNHVFDFNSSVGSEASLWETLHIFGLTSTTGAYFEAAVALNNSHIYSEAKGFIKLSACAVLKCVNMWIIKWNLSSPYVPTLQLPHWLIEIVS